jgi:hypothetical protein
MTEKKLRHYRIEVVFDSKDFSNANKIAEAMLKKCPYKTRILKLEECTLNT